MYGVIQKEPFMPIIGKMNRLTVKEAVPYGFLLEGDELGDLLLSNKQCKKKPTLGDKVNVFIYSDSDNNLTLTTRRPIVTVNEFGFLNVVQTEKIGAFLDWGLEKDLFVPISQQREKMKQGNYYVVYVYKEPGSNRIAASSKVENYINQDSQAYEVDQEVKILIYDRTDLGYKAIINHQHSGLLFHNEVFKPLAIGEKCNAFVKTVRADNKIDLILQKPGYQKPILLEDKILEALEKKDGYLPLNDRSNPDLIYQTFAVSKKKYKAAIGALYKKKKIVIEKDGIRLTG